MNAMFEGYGSNGAAYDEMFDGDALRPPYLRLRSSLETMDHEPCDRYVVVATGRDFRDVKPLSGIYSGARTSRMSVDVTLTRPA